jgi:inositol phosphorylceramide mannosyltransferase catalytic subunit
VAPRDRPTLSIPKIFHQIWLGDKPLPRKFIDYGHSWEKCHSGWHKIIWSEADLPSLRNQWAYEQTEVYAAKSNIARYEILLEHGGIYVDTDFECLKNIEPLLVGVECFVAWERDGLANNAIIGAIPGHPFVHDLVESLEQSVRALPDADPAVTQSGPYYLTNVLARHPEVTVLPSALFYPYQWHERWRRAEVFSEAYAVHHWTLSSRRFPEPHRLGDGRNAALSVVLRTPSENAPLKLEWALEGLSVQTISDFEVIIVGDLRHSRVERLVKAFSRHLDLRARNGPISATNGANARNQGIRAARAQRILFLDGDVLPDTDVVETHAQFGKSAFVPFGFRRIYPAEKMYPFEAPLDYVALRLHSVQDPRRSYPYPPFRGDWRDLEGFCFSAPTSLVRRLEGFNEALPEVDSVNDLARRLSASKALLMPMWVQGYVTHLGPPGSEGLVPQDPMSVLHLMTPGRSSSSSAIPATIGVERP